MPPEHAGNDSINQGDRFEPRPPASDTKCDPAVYAHISKYAKATWFGAFKSLFFGFGLWLSLLYIQAWWTLIPLVFVNVRNFLVFHDCAHLSFFPSARANRIAGIIMGGIVSTPCFFWTRIHNSHHKHSNNLDHHQISQSAPWTVEEYLSKPPRVRMFYRIYAHPMSMLFVNPLLLFWVYHPFRATKVETLSTVISWSVLTWLCGVWAVPWYLFVAGAGSAIMGVFLFHLQHTFEGVQRKRGSQWSYFENGMSGSTFLQVPWWLKWATVGIEYHHIHHLNARVPGYRLRECHEQAPKGMFDAVPRVTFMDGFRSLQLQLWDEKRGRLVSIADVERDLRAATTPTPVAARPRKAD
jgi:omega-6 fatty acid desaturase (delta-12 desaturase)